MATQKEAKQIRENVLALVAQLQDESMESLGRTSEGIVFAVGEEFVVVRAIVKSENFDANAAILAFSDKMQKAEAKAKEKKG